MGESPYDVTRRIGRERVIFRDYAQAIQDFGPSKSRRGWENPVNRRVAKVCPLCGSCNKQMTRHIRRQHGQSSSPSELANALAVVRIRKRRGKQTNWDKCKVCGERRANLRSHMILAHSVPADSEVLKSGKLGGPRAPEHQSVAGWLADYRRVHFNSLDGAVQSSKPATRVKARTLKLSRLSAMLDVIVGESGAKTLPDVVKNVKVLTRLSPPGYFQRPGVKAATVLKDVDALSEFLTYVEREELVNGELVGRAKARLGSARGNLKRQANIDTAEFQARDGAVTVLQPDIDKFRASAKALEAIAALSGGPVSKHSASNCRDYLIAEIFLANAVRPSAIVGLTRTDLREARTQTCDGVVYTVLGSASSKNAGATGKRESCKRFCSVLLTSGVAATVMFDPELAGRLSKFVTVVRPVLETAASPDDLFLMTNGSAMNDSQVSNGYRRIWRAAGLADPTFKTAANSRHIRHTASGLARTLGSPSLQKNVHIALNHSERTNEASYLSTVRPALTVAARAELVGLRKDRSSEFDSLVGGRPAVYSVQPPAKRKVGNCAQVPIGKCLTVASLFSVGQQCQWIAEVCYSDPG